MKKDKLWHDIAEYNCFCTLKGFQCHLMSKKPGGGGGGGGGGGVPIQMLVEIFFKLKRGVNKSSKLRYRNDQNPTKMDVRILIP